MVVRRKLSHVHLKGDAVGKFKEYCRDMHLSFEMKKARCGYTHFIVLVSESEEKAANTYLLLI